MTDYSVSDSKAAYAFLNIENRTAYMVSQLNDMVAVLLKTATREEKQKSSTFTRVQLTLPELSVGDLEEHSDYWKPYVPDDPEVLARVCRMLAEKFPFDEIENGTVGEVLGIDDKIRQTYQEIFEEPFSALKGYYKPKERKKTKDKIQFETEQLKKALEKVHLKRGEILFQKGDPGDSMFVIANGLVRVVVEQDGEEVVLSEMGRNEVVGEMALLTGDPRSATIYAVRDTDFYSLSKTKFEKLFEQDHLLVFPIIEQVVDRLKRSNTAKRQYNYPNIYTILPISPGTGEFGNKFVELMGLNDSVLHITRQYILDKVPKHIAQALEGEGYESELFIWLDEQDSQFDLVVYEADYELTPWTEICVQRAGRILLVGIVDENNALSEAEALLLKYGDKRWTPKQELVLIYPSGDQKPRGTSKWLQERRIERYHHVVSGRDSDYERLIRLIRGKASGLVFSGGGVRGAAHIGVLKAVEELGITLDFIGGTSAGSIFSAMYAMGMSSEEILQASSKYLFKKRVLLDYTFPIIALSAAKRISRSYEIIFGDTLIEDLPMPYFCLSTNISEFTQEVHLQGDLKLYVRASSSIPAVYPPVIGEDGSLLVDGGTINNLPINVIQDLMTGGRVIAVDVGEAKSQNNDYQHGMGVSGWGVLWRMINPFSKTVRVPSIFDTIARTSTLSSVQFAKDYYQQADVMIKPAVVQYGAFDTSKYAVMFELGYQAAMVDLKDWNT